MERTKRLVGILGSFAIKGTRSLDGLIEEDLGQTVGLWVDISELVL